jgi:ribonuclease HI
MDIKSHIKSLGVKELKDLQKFIESELKSKTDKPRKITKVSVYTDGASRGNPGHSGIGLLIDDENGDKIIQDFRYIGICTNNEAEYRALLLALDRAYEITQGAVDCFSDSELLVRQLNGQYAIKSEKLIKFSGEVKERIKQFSAVTFTHLPREHPKLRLADQLANRGIDEAKPK